MTFSDFFSKNSKFAFLISQALICKPAPDPLMRRSILRKDETIGNSANPGHWNRGHRVFGRAPWLGRAVSALGRRLRIFFDFARFSLDGLSRFDGAAAPLADPNREILLALPTRQRFSILSLHFARPHVVFLRARIFIAGSRSTFWQS